MDLQKLREWKTRKQLGMKSRITREASQEIQGLVLHDYGSLKCACFLLLTIVEPRKARAWLRELAERVTTAARAPEACCRNVAFTCDGLERLGLSSSTLETFPAEFQAGMAQRSHILGDTGECSPENWEFGGPEGKEASQKDLHVLLMLHAASPERMGELLEEERGQLEKGGMRVLLQQDASHLSEAKEHFGFREGVSQPRLKVEGADDKKGEEPLQAGEFVLGYRNEYQCLPWSPCVREEEYRGHEALGHLPLHPDPGSRDLGYNGTYLVLRKLEQDVRGFWRSLADSAKELGATDLHQETIRLAALLMGRWPGGTALTPDNVNADPREMKTRDSSVAYAFAEKDSSGSACPFGSHVRRANPRDALDMNASMADETGTKGDGRAGRTLAKARKRSLTTVSRHRLLRRSIPYGEPLVQGEALEGLEDLIEGRAAGADEKQRGLLFVAINANISRQFEFIQQTWLNNEKLEGYYDERDPIASGRAADAPAESHLTLPRTSPCKRVALRPFVTVKGGGYFFLPSVSALRFLAS